jgi:hypothetical protein
MAPSNKRHASDDERRTQERNHTMNAQHSTPVSAKLHRIGLPALWIGLSIVLISAVIVIAAPNRTAATASPKHNIARPALLNPNNPISGTGSAYDGRDYHAAPRPAPFNPNNPINGTGSAYNGQ